MCSPALFPDRPVVWKISAAWSSKIIDCTPRGIATACGAKCCQGNTYWPPKASGTGQCANLSADGCNLRADRPVTCLLYPLRLVGNSLVLHGRTLIPKSGYCAPCYKQGTQTIAEALRSSFEILFGVPGADTIIRNTLQGIDSYVAVPDWVLKSLADEQRWEKANATPPGRSHMHEEVPAGNPLNILQ